MADLLFIADAGHALNTPGKRTPDGEREWSFNNEIALGFEARMKQYSGASVQRVDDRTGSVDIPLGDRVQKAKNLGGDAFISFHHNALAGKWGTHGGTETFTKENPSTGSIKLAEAVHAALLDGYGLRNRGIKRANWYVINHNNMPAVLVEGGFMDSTTDIATLRNSAKLRAAGVKVADAVAKLYGLQLESTGSASNRTHTVVSGDTFWSISQKYGVTVKQLEKNNPSVDPAAIRIGTVLYIDQQAPTLVSKSSTTTAASSIKSVGRIEICNLKNFTYIYEKTSDSSRRLGKAKLGQRFSISGSVPGWWEIIFNGRRAYVKSKYGKRV